MTVAKPTTDDLVAWLKLQSTPNDQARAVFEECLNTAIDHIESRITLPATVGGAAESDTNYPQRVRTAILLTASRLAKRSTSPEGVAGLSDIGAVVRILARDPDVESLLSFYLTIGFA